MAGGQNLSHFTRQSGVFGAERIFYATYLIAVYAYFTGAGALKGAKCKGGTHRPVVAAQRCRLIQGVEFTLLR